MKQSARQMNQDENLGDTLYHKSNKIDYMQPSLFTKKNRRNSSYIEPTNLNNMSDQ